MSKNDRALFDFECLVAAAHSELIGDMRNSWHTWEEIACAVNAHNFIGRTSAKACRLQFTKDVVADIIAHSDVSA